MPGLTTGCSLWSRMGSTALGLFLSTVPAAAQGRPPLPPDLKTYLEIVDQYRSGRTTTAAYRIRAWDTPRVERLIKDVPSALPGMLRFCPERPDEVAFATIDAAVLLHTDAAFAELNDGREDGLFFHLDTAQKLLGWIVRRAAAETVRDLGRRGDVEGQARACGAPRPLTERDWYLAATLLMIRAWELPVAERFADRLTEAAPDDVETRFAVGALKEAQALNDAWYYLPPLTMRNEPAFVRAQARSLQSQRDVKRLRDAAQHSFARALAAAPGRHDIRLRLGWVLYQLERHGEAQSNLDAVLVARDADVPTRYLAALFLGRVAEAQGRLDAAVQRYEQAITIHPDGHTAPTALAHALDTRGARDRARDVLAGIVRAAGQQWTPVTSRPSAAVGDPWVLYPYGPWRIGEDTLNRLRAEVTVR